jgi:hypothetical protein
MNCRLCIKATWAFREAFFAQLANVSDRKVQFEIAYASPLPIAAIQAQIDSGEAYAQLLIVVAISWSLQIAYVLWANTLFSGKSKTVCQQNNFDLTPKTAQI